jgi:hypothetical protein
MSNRNQFRMPTPYEMEALKVAAHRARARHMKVLFRLAVRAVKSRIAHFALSTGPRVSHA